LKRLRTFEAESIDEVIRFILQLERESEENLFYFRGAKKEYDIPLAPFIYRGRNLEREHEYFREMQRFNDNEFTIDKTAFDKLSRMQHYGTPTRLLDISEDIMSALYFALEKNSSDTPAVIYVFEIDKQKIRYYDSDTVSVLANLAKTPLKNKDNPDKSKSRIAQDALEYLGERDEYNRISIKSKKYLLHDIKEEKPYFEDLINPEHIFSIQCVKPKFTNQRIHNQKGAFLLFGLNKKAIEEVIPLIENDTLIDAREYPHPIVNITKIRLHNIKLEHLERLGISKPFIYPDLEKVSEYLSKS